MVASVHTHVADGGATSAAADADILGRNQKRGIGNGWRLDDAAAACEAQARHGEGRAGARWHGMCRPHPSCAESWSWFDRLST